MSADLVAAGAMASQSDDPTFALVFIVGCLIVVALQIGPPWRARRD